MDLTGNKMTFNWNVLSQTLAAFVGGYAFAIASSFAMIPVSLLIFTANHHDAVFIGLLTSYVFYIAAIIWCFNKQNALIAWRDMFIASTFCVITFYLFPSGF